MVEIACPAHGVFNQTPVNHVRGKGCVQCGHISTRLKKTKDTDWFVNRARALYGGVYDYSKAKYSRKRDEVTIICDIHGEFKKTPDKHLAGQGCPLCAYANSYGAYSPEAFQRNPGLYEREGYLYVARFHGGAMDESFIKVGITVNRPEKRWAGNGPTGGGGYVVDLMYTLKAPIGRCFEIEQWVLGEVKANKFAYWPRLEFGGRTECMSSDGWELYKALLEQQFTVSLIPSNKRLRKAVQNQRR